MWIIYAALYRTKSPAAVARFSERLEKLEEEETCEELLGNLPKFYGSFIKAGTFNTEKLEFNDLIYKLWM